MANNFFTICSFFYSFMLNIIYFRRKNVDNVETKIYSKLILANLFNVIFAILCYFTIINSDKIPFLNDFVSKTLLVLFITWELLFILYGIYITRKDEKAFTANLKKSKYMIIAMYLMIMFFTYALPLYYYNENRMVYSYGPSSNLIYTLTGILIFIWIIIITKNYSILKSKKCIPIILFIVLTLIVVVIQKINPGLLLITATETFITVLMYFTIENPDMKLLNEIHKSKEISDNANEEKTLFLYNMTQEIREVTGKINEEANNILDTNSVDDNKESARNILSHTSSFATITNDILDVSSLEASNLKVYNNKYNIKTLIKELITIYDKTSKNKEIKFITNIDHNIPELLYGDNISLKEVLNVILSNSVKYTNAGYVEFSVNTIIKNDVCRLIITIEDSGLGIKGDEINEIKMNNKSLGKANKMITVMNGTMMISSDYGMGTKVKIILDQKICEDNNNEELKYEEILDEKNILMVDDSDAGIKIVEKHIKGTNIKLETVKNGKECLNKIKANKYDLILMNEKLSSVSGDYLLSKMKDIRNFNTKVILLTKDSSNEYKEDYLNLGFTDYVLKPIKKEELLSKISKYTKKGS